MNDPIEKAQCCACGKVYDSPDEAIACCNDAWVDFYNCATCGISYDEKKNAATCC